ncbi:MAG TPA: DUF2927 domain-containing protein [Thermohalobaculum sp.]|nr:DUF2927 domain-containing protein [Thermohalobaculum sp.]
MSRSVLRLALSALIISALALVAGCGGRPSADDYADYETALRASGKLRTETAPKGAPYGAADLVRNFERVALHHEADATVPGGEGNWNPNPLMRWDGPLNYGLFGDAITPDDRAEAARLMNRIGALTGLKITETDENANFLILITKPEERDGYSADLAKFNPALAETFDFWRRTPQVICVANNLFSHEDNDLIIAALIVIGSETTDLLRQACLHEEIVQGLGLANDHPDVRPSIFNDDGEFALLTEHDEHLLRILYDPRLKPGMAADQAMPIVRQIVAEIPLEQPASKLSGGISPLTPIVGSDGSRPLATNNVPSN